jgi:hypothetical protein
MKGNRIISIGLIVASLAWSPMLVLAKDQPGGQGASTNKATKHGTPSEMLSTLTPDQRAKLTPKQQRQLNRESLEILRSQEETASLAF